MTQGPFEVQFAEDSYASMSYDENATFAVTEGGVLWVTDPSAGTVETYSPTAWRLIRSSTPTSSDHQLGGFGMS